MRRLDKPIIAVAVYECDKAFGGPEEGGWWYDTGVLCIGKQFPLPVFVRGEKEARTKAEYMKKHIEFRKLNEGRYEPGSVLCEGYYEVRTFEGELPKYFPETKPRYE